MLRPAVLFALLVLAAPLVLLLALLSGTVPVTLADLPPALGFAAADGAATDTVAVTVLRDLRVPRVALACLLGAALAVSGAAMQGLFRNPLADPSVIGVSSGASLGASLAIVFGSVIFAAAQPLYIVTAGAFFGGLLVTWLVYWLAGRQVSAADQGVSIVTLLLLGVAITAVAAAINNLLTVFADNELLRRISLWNMGSLGAADYSQLLLATVLLAPVMLLTCRLAGSLDALLLGEVEAMQLGVDVDRLKRYVIALVAMAVGVAVALGGVITFVGLVVPHIVRLLIGPSHRYLLPLSLIAGALLLVLADTLARSLLAPAEIPIGVLTALLGAPVFAVLLLRRNDYVLR